MKNNKKNSFSLFVREDSGSSVFPSLIGEEIGTPSFDFAYKEEWGKISQSLFSKIPALDIFISGYDFWACVWGKKFIFPSVISVISPDPTLLFEKELGVDSDDRLFVILEIEVEGIFQDVTVCNAQQELLPASSHHDTIKSACRADVRPRGFPGTGKTICCMVYIFADMEQWQNYHLSLPSNYMKTFLSLNSQALFFGKDLESPRKIRTDRPLLQNWQRQEILLLGIRFYLDFSMICPAGYFGKISLRDFFQFGFAEWIISGLSVRHALDQLCSYKLVPVQETKIFFLARDLFFWYEQRAGGKEILRLLQMRQRGTEPGFESSIRLWHFLLILDMPLSSFSIEMDKRLSKLREMRRWFSLLLFDGGISTEVLFELIEEFKEFYFEALVLLSLDLLFENKNQAGIEEEIIRVLKRCVRTENKILDWLNFEKKNSDSRTFVAALIKEFS